ncbi:MAG: hypothetical protein ACRDX8_14975, partial [Acidimicrobiales bacterium]
VYPTPASTTTTTIITGSSSAPVALSNADSGNTIDLRVGQSVTVTLSGTMSFPWSEPDTGNSAVLARESGSANPRTGDSYATFLAVGAGATDVTAIQNPLCLQARPMCALPSRLWRVTVNVTS